MAKWAETSGLHLSPGKTKAIVFGSRNGVHFINSLELQGIGLRYGKLIPFSSEVVNLMITRDSKLTRKPQIEQV